MEFAFQLVNVLSSFKPRLLLFNFKDNFLMEKTHIWIGVTIQVECTLSIVEQLMGKLQQLLKKLISLLRYVRIARHQNCNYNFVLDFGLYKKLEDWKTTKRIWCMFHRLWNVLCIGAILAINLTCHISLWSQKFQDCLGTKTKAEAKLTKSWTWESA